MAKTETVLTDFNIREFDNVEQMGAHASDIGLNDFVITPDTSIRLPILTPMWFDHQANDESWLNADTFSWHSGDVYKAAYEHLVDDLKKTKLYCWDYDDIYVYTLSQTPTKDDALYNEFGEQLRAEFINTVASDYSSINIWTGAGDYDYARRSDQDVMVAKTDTIGDITITYYQAKDGHKICLPDQESNLVALYEATGVAWYYLLDQTNRQFKLPRTKWGFTGVRDSVGGYVAPGLPSIEHTHTWSHNDNTGGSGFALLFNESGTTVQTITTSTNSAVSPIYGASDTVQPPATQMYLYFYIGAFSQAATEQTAGLNAELFNNKADMDLGNIPANYDYVIESQLPTSNNNYTWYRKYKSGWVEQGGRLTATKSSGFNTITLPVEMQDGNYTASATNISAYVEGTGSSHAYVMAKAGVVNSLATTSFGIFSQNSGEKYSWQVSGIAQG